MTLEIGKGPIPLGKADPTCFRLSDAPDNALEKTDDGYYVAPIEKNVSKKEDNMIEVLDDGIYVPPLKISEEEDNAIEMLEDGLYAPSTPGISELEGNSLRLEEDGLYVPTPDVPDMDMTNYVDDVTIKVNDEGRIYSVITDESGVPLPEYSVAVDNEHLVDNLDGYTVRYHLTRDGYETGAEISVPHYTIGRTSTGYELWSETAESGVGEVIEVPTTTPGTGIIVNYYDTEEEVSIDEDYIKNLAEDVTNVQVDSLRDELSGSIGDLYDMASNNSVRIDDLEGELNSTKSDLEQLAEQVVNDKNELESSIVAVSERIDDITNSFDDYALKENTYTKEEVDAKFADSNLPDMSEYLKKEEADETYASKDDVYSKDEIDKKLDEANFPDLDNYLEKDEADQKYLGKDEAESLYLTKDEAGNDFYSREEIDRKLEEASFPDLDAYLEKDVAEVTYLKKLDAQMIYARLDNTYDKSDIDQKFADLDIPDVSGFVDKNYVDNRLDTLDGNITAVEGKVLAFESEVEALNTQIEAVEKTTEALDDKIDNITNDIETKYLTKEAAAYVYAQKSELEEVNSHVNTLDSDLKQAKDDIKVNAENIDTLTRRTDGLESTIEELNDELSTKYLSKEAASAVYAQQSYVDSTFLTMTDAEATYATISSVDKKQDKLTAGDNITLTPGNDGTVTISATGGGSGNYLLTDGSNAASEVTLPKLSTRKIVATSSQLSLQAGSCLLDLANKVTFFASSISLKSNEGNLSLETDESHIATYNGEEIATQAYVDEKIAEGSTSGDYLKTDGSNAETETFKIGNLGIRENSIYFWNQQTVDYPGWQYCPSIMIRDDRMILHGPNNNYIFETSKGEIAVKSDIAEEIQNQIPMLSEQFVNLRDMQWIGGHKTFSDGVTFQGSDRVEMYSDLWCYSSIIMAGGNGTIYAKAIDNSGADLTIGNSNEGRRIEIVSNDDIDINTTHNITLASYGGEINLFAGRATYNEQEIATKGDLDQKMVELGLENVQDELINLLQQIQDLTNRIAALEANIDGGNA